MKKTLTILFATYSIFLLGCEGDNKKNSRQPFDTGEQYAYARIIIDGEQEWQYSQKHPGNYKYFNGPKTHAGCQKFPMLQECVRSYIEDGNISGIRCAFLAAYAIVNMPINSGDLLSSYGDPLHELLKKLGDKEFTSALKKMRPETQSAVLCLMYFHAWDDISQEGDSFTELYVKKYPIHCAHARSVPKYAWPAREIQNVIPIEKK